MEEIVDKIKVSASWQNGRGELKEHGRCRDLLRQYPRDLFISPRPVPFVLALWD